MIAMSMCGVPLPRMSNEIMSKLESVGSGRPRRHERVEIHAGLLAVLQRCVGDHALDKWIVRGKIRYVIGFEERIFICPGGLNVDHRADTGAALASARMTDDQLRTVRARLDELEAAPTADELLEADLALEETLVRSRAAHRNIYEALAARDPEAARAISRARTSHLSLIHI